MSVNKPVWRVTGTGYSMYANEPFDVVITIKAETDDQAQRAVWTLVSDVDISDITEVSEND